MLGTRSVCLKGTPSWPVSFENPVQMCSELQDTELNGNGGSVCHQTCMPCASQLQTFLEAPGRADINVFATVIMAAARLNMPCITGLLKNY
jgi:hypothetical protein